MGLDESCVTRIGSRPEVADAVRSCRSPTWQRTSTYVQHVRAARTHWHRRAAQECCTHGAPLELLPEALLVLPARRIIRSRAAHAPTAASAQSAL